jgi:2-methylisocitrate lyase-like PEP mutase family enzyme
MSTAQADRARAFAKLHEGPGAFVIPNPWDIGSARILAGMGFKALATTSAGMAFALGRRDGAVSRDEALAHCRAVARATPLPVAGDLENGYGDAPEFVAETIRRAADSGLVGASIEDSTGRPDSPIYDRSLAVERVAAAVEAARRLPFPFTLTARAENFLHGRNDLDDTIDRLRAFQAAGADVLFAPGVRQIEQVRQICQSVTHPVNVLAGLPGASFTVDALAAAGVRRISLGSGLARAAYNQLVHAAGEILEHGTFGFVDAPKPAADFARFLAPRDVNQPRG